MLIAASGVDVRELRKQQLKLGLLRASRVLLSCQPHLRQILSGISPVDQGLSEVEAGVEEVSEEDPESESSPANTILQLLMSIATQPSPIKAVFSREELEVRKNDEVNTVHCGFFNIQSILRFIAFRCWVIHEINFSLKCNIYKQIMLKGSLSKNLHTLQTVIFNIDAYE